MDSNRVVSICGRPVPPGVVAATGAVELTVHGWDIARTVGVDRPIPPALAEEILDLVSLFVSPADRPGRFAPPVRIAATARPGDRLVAFLGRDPFVPAISTP
jgi:uncharacterized protein (TIGR03086 family)